MRYKDDNIIWFWFEVVTVMIIHYNVVHDADVRDVVCDDDVHDDVCDADVCDDDVIHAAVLRVFVSYAGPSNSKFETL